MSENLSGDMQLWLIEGEKVTSSFFYDASAGKCTQAGPGFESLVGASIEQIKTYCQLRRLGLSLLPGEKIS